MPIPRGINFRLQPHPAMAHLGTRESYPPYPNNIRKTNCWRQWKAAAPRMRGGAKTEKALAMAAILCPTAGPETCSVPVIHPPLPGFHDSLTLIRWLGPSQAPQRTEHIHQCQKQTLTEDGSRKKILPYDFIEPTTSNKAPVYPKIHSLVSSEHFLGFGPKFWQVSLLLYYHN